MQSQTGSIPRAVLCKAVAALIALGSHLALAGPACAAITSGVYQTGPDATVSEWGDRVPNGSRVVPFFATLTFDMSGAEPALTAVITNAVLEGGDPFELTVHSSAGSQLGDSGYMFTGDYLDDIYPSGTQYLFDWKFSAATNGSAVWDGTTSWTGGHAWYVTISNITVEPVAWLKIARVGTGSVQIT